MNSCWEEYKTWTPRPCTPSVDQAHRPGLSTSFNFIDRGQGKMRRKKGTLRALVLEENRSLFPQTSS